MEGQIKEWTGQSMSSLMRIADGGGQWAVITLDASVRELRAPNDVWASREFVNWLIDQENAIDSVNL